MEETSELEIGIGDKEVEVLKPAKVKVVEVSTDEVTFGTKKNKKVILSCKHPDRDEPIAISKVKIARKDKLTTSGLWLTLDEDKKIQKNSSLAMFLVFANVQNLKELKEKEFDAIADDDGYLVIKSY